jgi:outer membrane lipoprotein-sorting protein
MRKFFVLTSLMIAFTVSAQNDQKARAILEETSKKMQSFQTISASFSFTMDNAKMNIREKNSGSLLMKGAKYQVKLPDMGMQVFSDGKTVWNFMQDANQVTISSAGDENQGVIDPTSIFNVYQEGYTYKFIEDKTIGGKTISYIDLIPVDKNKEFTNLTVGIEKAKMIVNSLVTHGKDGNLYGIYVNEFKTDQPIPESEFIFKKEQHKDIEVIDFR